MATNEYAVDRSNWPAGPWDAEPEDRVEWRDAATGLPCIAARGGGGAWCGYVAVPPGHPWHGQGYDEVHGISDVSVHGGLTFAAPCDPGHPVCHTPAAGEPADVWWLGFDTSHYGDARPDSLWRDGVYRTLAYVRDECASLAAQAASAGEDPNRDARLTGRDLGVRS